MQANVSVIASVERRTVSAASGWARKVRQKPINPSEKLVSIAVLIGLAPFAVIASPLMILFLLWLTARVGYYL
jgi:hypothetical protein